MACMVCGAVVWAQEAGSALWLNWAALTGSALCGLELLHDSRWPHRGKGLLGLAHMALAGVLGLGGGPMWLIFVVIGVGCVGSHMPRTCRHWSILHGPERDGDEAGLR